MKRALLAVAYLTAAVVLSSSTARADDIGDNAKARVDAAGKAYRMSAALLREGKGAGADRVYLWSRRWMEAEQDLAADAEGRVAAAEAHRKRMAELAEAVRKLADAGLADPADLAGGDFYLLEAERDVIRAKRK